MSMNTATEIALRLMPAFYWKVLAVCLVISLLVRLIHMVWYDPYLSSPTSCGVSGFDIAKRLLQDEGITNTQTGLGIKSEYSWTDRKITLPSAVGNDCSIVSSAVSAHEFGHAKQHASNTILGAAGKAAPYILSSVRSSIPWLFLGSLFSKTSMKILLAMMALAFLLAAVNFLMECEASVIGYRGLKKLEVFSKSELRKCFRVLCACSATYLNGMTDVPMYQWRFIWSFFRRAFSI